MPNEKENLNLVLLPLCAHRPVREPRAMDRAINALMLANGVTPPSNPRPNIIRVKGAKS